MPWRETCRMDQKREFVLAWRSHTMSRTALCRLYGISRQTGYKWARRFARTREWHALDEHSRRPHRSPRATPRLLVQRICAERLRRPLEGPRTLRARLRQKWPRVRWPAPSTLGAILRRARLVVPRVRRARRPPRTQPFALAREPNDVWCIDFKGDFALGDGRRCYPLTVTDAASRYLLACVGFHAPTTAHVRAVLIRLFQTYGLPTAIRSDNGAPFASMVTPAGLTTLSAWWAKLGIRLERIDPGKPYQNGRHERLHLTLKRATCLPPKHSLGWQQRAFDAFERDYNHRRPHQALELATPASRYTPSPRRLPALVPVPQYPFADIYRVSPTGTIRWRARTVFVSSTLADECVGLYALDARYCEVVFANIVLGVIDAQYPHYGLLHPKTRANAKPTSRLSAMSPV